MQSRADVPSASAEENSTQKLFRDYETFAESNRAAFVFESWVLLWSSVLLSVTVSVYGAYLFHKPEDTTAWARGALIAAGAFGALLATVVRITFDARNRAIGHGDRPPERGARH